MENLNRKKLSVRIALDDISKVKGTGILFLQNDGDGALIFSVAHIFDGKISEDRINLFLNIVGDKDQVYSVHESFKLFSGSGNVKDNDIVLHPDYDKKSLDNDLAIIKISWKEWMREFTGFEITSGIEEKEVGGWGFPVSMQPQQEVNEQLIPQLKAAFRGRIENVQKKVILINYESSKVDSEIDRNNETSGFSGTALFSEGGFVGCVSKLAGNDTAGSRIFACAANQYIELMCKFNLKPKLPDSLNEYGKNILNLIPVEKKATRNFINEQIKNLIDTGKLKPCNYMGDNKEGQNNLKCNGFREICRKYWEGEVISAFCFIPLKEVKPEEVSYFCIKVQTNGDVKIVKVVFICTELIMSQSIQKLMDFSFFNTSDQKEDGILFLWNNQNDDAYYHGTLSKSDSMNIVRKITEDYLTFDIEDVQERMDMFHIVEGDKLRCNIAAIGVGQIRDTVLYSGNGNKQFMKNMLDSLIENAWS